MDRQATNASLRPPLPTFVNDASARLLDAVLFAHGAGHIELGDDAQLLVDWMVDYLDHKKDVPDMLLNRISALGQLAETPLMRLLEDETVSGEKQMLAIGLLREIGSVAPLQRYVDWQCGRAQEDDLCDNALDSLEQMGELPREALLEALGQANLPGKEALLSLLSRLPGDARTLEELLQLFEQLPHRRAILAAYLGRLGDPAALPVLEKAAEEENLGYLDFIEIRSAIEELGGTAPAREFYDDPEYEALFPTRNDE